MALPVELNAIGWSASCSEDTPITHSAQISCFVSTSVLDKEGSASERDSGDPPRISQTPSSPDELEEIKEVKDWKPSNEDKVGLVKLTTFSLQKRCVALANELSIVGLSYLVKPSSFKVGSVTRKFVWTILLLIGVVAMIFQILASIDLYLSYPTKVNYNLAYSGRLRFPAVTVCSENDVSLQRVTRAFGKTGQLV